MAGRGFLPFRLLHELSLFVQFQANLHGFALQLLSSGEFFPCAVLIIAVILPDTMFLCERKWFLVTHVTPTNLI
jgi:hypothetical protein